MKKIHSFFNVVLVVLCLHFTASGQVGIGTATPNTKAVLELKSPVNNQGLLVPRLTTAQRNAIGSLTAQDHGLLVYDSDDQKFYYWQGSQWLPLQAGTEVVQDLALTGSTLTITNNASATPISLAQFLGTNTDNQTLAYTGSTGQLSITGGNNVTITTAGTAGGDLSGSYPNPTIASKVITAGKIAPSTVSGQVLTTVGSTTQWANLPAGGGALDATLAAGNDAKQQTAVNFKALAVNTTQAPGALNVNGSHFMGVTLIEGDHDVKEDDYIIVGPANKGAIVTLPEAAKSRGRVLTIRATAKSAEFLLRVRAFGSDTIDGFISPETLLFFEGALYAITIVATEKGWLTIDRSIAPADRDPK
jgi:hypothetical protein